MTTLINSHIIICRSVRDLKFVTNKNFNTNFNYIIASDDIRVHQKTKDIDWIDKAIYIEKAESLYSVSDEVIIFLDEINRCLSQLVSDNSISKELLYWEKHAEGGITTQRIQDTLLLINSYLSLIERYQISRIYLVKNSFSVWEDSVLKHVLNSRRIDISYIKKLLPRGIHSQIFLGIKNYLREPYQLFKILKSKIVGIFQSKKIPFSKSVFIRFCGSYPKHINHPIALMRSLKKIDYNPVGLIWGEDSKINKNKIKKLNIINLQRWVSIFSILKISFHSLLIFIRLVKRKNQVLINKSLTYKDVPIGSLLWQSMCIFILCEFPERYRKMVSIKNFFKGHSPLAIWYCTISFIDDILIYNEMQNENIIKVHWPAFNSFISRNPYNNQKIPIDLSFAVSVNQKKVIDNSDFYCEYKPKKIAVTGSYSQVPLDKFINENSVQDSRNFLKIPDGYSSYILYDPGYILRGYLSPSEQMQTLELLFNYVQINEEIALLIKPHPNYRSEEIEDLMSYYNLKNTYLIDKKMLPYHAINAADFIITKISIIGFDSMYMRKPVISTIFDKEQEFKVFENSAEYIYEYKSLITLLDKLKDKDFKLKWTSDMNDRSKKLLEKLSESKSESPYDIASKEIHSSVLVKFDKNNID